MANDILVKIGADISDFSRKMAESSKSLSNFSKASQQTFDSFKQVGTVVTGAGVAIAGGLGVAAKHAIDFESSFAGVKKTVDTTEEGFKRLEKGIRDMAKELPASANDIAGVAEAAGQLGIAEENILSFTRTIIDLGESTNLSAEQGATEFARFANIVGMSQENFDRLGSSIVALGNSMATTEAEIMSMAMRLAAQGSQVGMTEAQILALAGTMSSLGIQAEMGGTAMTTILKKIQSAVAAGGKDLEDFASAAHMTSEEFKKLFERDAIMGLDALVKGLAKSSEEGEVLSEILTDLGMKGIYESDVMQRLAGATDLLSEAVITSSNAWEENTALSDEAAQRYETMASKLAILKNTLIDAGISIGQALMPAIGKVTEFIQNLVEKFNGLSEGTKQFIAISAAVVTALMLIVGPILLLIGFIPQIIAGFTTMSTVFTAITGPVGIVIAAILAIVTTLVVAYNKVEWFRDLVNSAWEFIKGATVAAFNYVKGIISAVISDVVDIASKYLNKFKDLWSRHGDAIMAIVGVYINNVKNTINLVMGVIKGIFEVVWPIITNVVKVAWEFIKLVVSNALDIITGVIDFAMSVIQGDWSGAWNAIKGIAENIVGNILKFFKNVNLMQVGKDMIKGLIKGISSMANAVVDSVKGVVDGAVKGAKKLLGIKSPSRVLMEIGKWTTIGLAEGIEDYAYLVDKASVLIAESAIPDVKNIDMSYATPDGVKAIMSAINGTVEVRGKHSQGITQNITIVSPDATSPYENARQIKKAQRELAMEWGM